MSNEQKGIIMSKLINGDCFGNEVDESIVIPLKS